MSNIRLSTISIDSTDSLTIRNGYINLTDTTASTSPATGSFVADGGVGINCSIDAISSTSGSALTVAGGVGINGKTYLGSDLSLDNSLSTFTVKGFVYPRLFLDTINNKSFTISLDGMNRHFLLNNNNLTINTSGDSLNNTSGALVINGGVSINNNANATSSTCGGTLTVGGGASIASNMYIGSDLHVNNKVYTNNINSNQLNINSSIGNINTTCGTFNLNLNSSFNINTITTNENYINTFNINSTSCSLNTTLNAYDNLFAYKTVQILSTTNATSFLNTTSSLTVAGGIHVYKDMFLNGDIHINDSSVFYGSSNTSCNFRFNGSSGSFILNGPGNGTIFNNGTVNISNGTLLLNDINNTGYILQSINENLNISSYNNSSLLNLFTTHGDWLDDNYISIYGYGKTIYDNNLSYLKIGYNSFNETYTINVDNATTPQPLCDLIIGNKNGSVIIASSGSVFLTNTVGSLCSTSGSLYISGGLSISCTNNASSVTNGGSMTIAGGVSINKDTFIGGNLNINGSLLTSSTFNIYNTNLINIGSSNGSYNNISIKLYTLGNDNNNTNCDYLSISNTSDLGYTFTSNVGTSSGRAHYLNFYTGTNNNQLFLATSGNIGLYTTSPAYTLDINGNLKSNNFIYSDNLVVNSNISTNSLYINNDVTVIGTSTFNDNILVYQTVNMYNTTNSISNISGGSLNIFGGAGIRKDLYIGGTIVCNSTGTFNNVLVNNTGNNAILSAGGITINCSTNSTSISNGGSLTVVGGVAIGNDMYIGGKMYLSKGIYTNNVSNLLNVYDNFNIQRFGINYNIDLSVSRYDANSNLIENIVTFNNTSGSVVFNNTTNSTSLTTGCVVYNGGLTISCSSNASSVSIGNALTIAGGASINRDMYIGGNVSIVSTTTSNDINSGSLIVAGGAGISGNLNIGGNTVINGNLIINGSTTNVDTTNTLIQDNILLLNSGPSGSHDSGILIQRYQASNDSGTGDVVNDNPYLVDTLPTQFGISSPSNGIKLSYLTSSVDNYYSNWWIKVNSGFSVNQTRKIISYNGTTHVATLNAPWTTQNPANGDVVYLYNKPFVGMIYNELTNVFQFGSTTNDPGNTYVSLTDSIGISFNTARCNNTNPSTNATSGAFIITGGMSINCTQNATSNTCGGSITIAGGASIRKSLFVAEHLNVNNVNITPNQNDIISSVTYNVLNNQLDIPFLTINSSCWSFDIYLAAFVNMSISADNLYCNFNIRGVNKGSTSWEIITSYVGDDTGIEFDMDIDNSTKNGILMYSTPDYGININSITFKYRMITN